VCHLQLEDVTMEDEKGADKPQNIALEAKDSTQKSAGRKVINQLM